MKYILIFLLSLLFLSCGQKDNRCIINSPNKIANFSTDFNPFRQKIGLPIIKSEWENDSIRWNNGIFWRIDNEDYHFQKVIEFSCDTIIIETDEYRNNVLWNPGTKNLLVAISISYYFDKNKSPNKTRGFVCRIDTIDPKFNLPDSTFIDLKQAESYLSAWGINRLD